MSSSEIAISARGLSKSYVIEHKAKETTAAETLLKYMANPLRQRERETVWSLDDVSFDIKRGEVVGVIGRNGAGKSTLLKVLSRITEPTRGEARIVGRVGSLIEVGTGFQPELTGRENIYLNGAILGMRRSEITRRFDQIVDFSGVEKYLDTPVKRYSSGMYVRLAFAVAAHLDTDILFVDEVLSVGDAEFQQKCLGRLGDVANEGRTVLFVSHNPSMMEALCKRGIVLNKGRLIMEGPIKDALSEYHRAARIDLGGSDTAESGPVTFSGSNTYIKGGDILDENGESTRVIRMATPISFTFEVETPKTIEYPVFEILFYNLVGTCMMGVRSPNTRFAIDKISGKTQVTCTVDNLPFVPGDYTYSVSLIKGGATLETVETGLTFMVCDADTFGDGWGACILGNCVAASRWGVSEAQPQFVATKQAV